MLLFLYLYVYLYMYVYWRVGLFCRYIYRPGRYCCLDIVLYPYFVRSSFGSL